MSLLLALDIGTTSIKAGIFDLSGRMIASANGEYNLEKPAPNIVELDPEIYWQTTIDVINELREKCNFDSKEIAAIGITGQAETFIVVDKSGKLLRKAIVWLDNRSQKETEEISENFNIDDVFRITGQQEITPTWTATKILWLKNNEPEIFAKAAKFLMVEDYIAAKLTGTYATDMALNASTLYYNMPEKKWWKEMLSFLEIGEEKLPSLKTSGEIIGETSSIQNILPKGIPVSITAIDQVAGAVGAGNIGSGIVTETTGSALAVCATLDKPYYDQKKQIGLYPHAIQNKYVLMPWAPTAGMLLRWFKDNFAETSSYQELNDLATETSPGADGLMMLPHFSGSLMPDFSPKAKGALHGLSLSHSKKHFVRAIFEAVAFLLKDNLELIRKSGVDFSKIISLGGGAHSDTWLQIKADVLQLPIETMQCEESACLGAAILAGTGAGIFKDINTATAEMCKIKQQFLPDPKMKETYDMLFAKYQNLNKIILSTF